MLFSRPAVYFEKLAVTDHFCAPVGSQVTPSRRLKAPAVDTSSAAPLRPLFLSQRTPRLAVRRPLTDHTSLKKREWVRKLLPCVRRRIGLHRIRVLALNWG